MPYKAELKQTGAHAKISRLCACDERAVEAAAKLLQFAVEEDRAWPFEVALDRSEFERYFLSHAAFQCTVDSTLLVKDGGSSQNSNVLRFGTNAENERVVGVFYVKPNFPGRCNHLCNGGFITAPNFRGRGVGEAMGRCFLRVARDLGFGAALFNLVFANNKASIAMWEKLRFKRIGTIPRAARMRRDETSEAGCSEHDSWKCGDYALVDAHQYYYDLTESEFETDHRPSVVEASTLDS